MTDRAYSDIELIEIVATELDGGREPWLFGRGTAASLARQLPHLLACAKFVEEHGALLQKALNSDASGTFEFQWDEAIKALAELRRAKGGET